MTMTTSQILLRDFNHARAVHDVEFISRRVTDDIRWTIVGKRTIEGKQAFSNEIQGISDDEPRNVRVTHIIVDGSEGVVHGTMSGTNRVGEKETLAFCDIYKLSRSRDPRIREITSYTIALDSA